MEAMFRDLKASEIDVRIASERINGISLLLYKDARCVFVPMIGIIFL